ncbi:aminopeptidase P family protein [Carboxylicivirga sp. N1Y90]|uniref:aminopeptidase P family protein n=1 Tax=Carboxylicivirga fragile TaxID=3417571 RepID=UPI003D35867E|nr:aminopeptidase P family protein [Marinilabiliaceae bacterium N1Y90]
MSAADHIFKLRSYMGSLGVDAYIIPSSDPHLSEYIADHWKFRDWLSGFTGSAGTLVVTMEGAGLWTDSRYFLQAETQLDEAEITLFKMGEADTPDYKDWLSVELHSGSVVGINGKMITVNAYRELAKTLKKVDIRLDGRLSLEDEVWEGRPPIPEDGIFELETKYCGVSRKEKIQFIRKLMKEKGATHYVIAALDEIAWFLNFRGTDVSFNPVFHSYLIITENQINLFIDPHKLTSTLGKQLTSEGIKIFLYNDFYAFIKDMLQDSIILVDPNRVNSSVFSHLPSQAAKIEEESLINQLKAIKNPTEIDNIRKAMVKDGVAVVQFLHWLDSAIGKEYIDEYSAAKKLKSFRKQQENYQGDSFNSISGYAGNGAIVHYSVEKDSAAELKPQGFYLIDSGGQYLEGTTDITRTIALGELSSDEKKDFTLVLKGHIALDKATFPQGTRGVHLDILARQALWSQGLNYGHGTGHGVGHFLNVHEGPQSIRPQDNGVELKAGMITSNEPGIYREGKHGIRIENLILCNKALRSEFGNFMNFETLTLCPIDLNAVDTNLLTDEEKIWLNDYHSKVRDLLEQQLEGDVKEWLKLKTQSI